MGGLRAASGKRAAEDVLGRRYDRLEVRSRCCLAGGGEISRRQLDLERLGSELPPGELAAAQDAAKASDFETVVTTAEHVLGGALAGRRS